MSKNIQDLQFRPLKYPQFFEYWKLAKRNPWTVFELDFLGDIQDWKNNLSEMERNAITRALTAFTQIEQIVGEYWTDTVAKNYLAPEIIMMARAFGDQESTHLYAYNYLEEILGLDTFESFVQNEAALNKVAALLDDKSDPLTSLAVFSGAVEGCSLFASFALLCSFCGDNKMKTIKEILGWSAVDEEIHSKAGIDLFHQFKDQGFDKKKIIEGFDAVLENEVKFIDYVMMDGDLPSMKKEDLIDYLYFRANEKLVALGLEEEYLVHNKNAARNINRMMVMLTQGKSHDDFFAGKASSSYTAVILQDFTKLKYDKKNSLFDDYVRLDVN